MRVDEIMSRSKRVFNPLGDVWHRILALRLSGRSKSRLIWVFSSWLTVLVLIYLIGSLKLGQLRDDISQSGTSSAKLFASQVSLPLLQRDMETLSTILNTTTSRPDVIYAAIIDHKNNIMAYTNPELIMPVNKGSLAQTVDNVSFWEGLSADQQEIISFSTNVTYSRTKIGEIYLALSAAEIGNWKNRIGLIAVASFVIFSLVGVASHFEVTWRNLCKQKHSTQQAPIPGIANMECPLCGSDKPFSERAISHVNMDRLMFLQPKNDEPFDKHTLQSHGISLSEMAERQDLGWLKRQVIFRCTEIIRKLAG
ncbi:MAG: hypothetical protein BBJ60_02245 [Desulfobacterales bacterium S7086C20]|nr:MAG: hypothetical protein BBJ60_02245 [Desulfobacterales bacterium S7086C20]